MKKLFSLLILVLAFTACDNNNAQLSINIPSAADSTAVFVSKLSLNTISVEDTLYIAAGKAKTKLAFATENPDFYYLSVENGKSVSLMLQAKDNVNVTISPEGETTIVGSEESANVDKLDREFEATYKQFNSTSDQKELSKLYVEYHRASLKYLMKNSRSMTCVPVLYRKFSDQLPVFLQSRDMLVYKRVYDSLRVVYPTSPYIVSLGDQVAVIEKNMQLEHRLNTIEEIGFPDLYLPDINGENKVLSELKGKVIVLMFWNSNVPEHKIFNMELKKLYNKYGDKGLEIYQVSTDIDKTVWSQVVKSQELPWISVCDGQGVDSRALTLYNITKVPSMFIIDKSGDMTGDKDVFDPAKLERLIKGLL